MSVNERIIWEMIRKDKLGFRFKRQVPVGPYILDFYCPEASLCIEVDGEQHELRRDKDLARDQYLESKGILTIRIPWTGIHESTSIELTKWIDRIQAICQERAKPKE